MNKYSYYTESTLGHWTIVKVHIYRNETWTLRHNRDTGTAYVTHSKTYKGKTYCETQTYILQDTKSFNAFCDITRGHRRPYYPKTDGQTIWKSINRVIARRPERLRFCSIVHGNRPAHHDYKPVAIAINIALSPYIIKSRYIAVIDKEVLDLPDFYRYTIFNALNTPEFWALKHKPLGHSDLANLKRGLHKAIRNNQDPRYL